MIPDLEKPMFLSLRSEMFELVGGRRHWNGGIRLDGESRDDMSQQGEFIFKLKYGVLILSWKP